MTNATKVTFFWLFITVGYVFHSLYHLSGATFGEDIKMEGATGTMPYWMHFFRIVLEIIPLTFALLTTVVSAQLFRTISFIWAILLGLANVMHLAEELIHTPENLSQVALLSWILAVNIVLIITASRWRKEI